MRKKILWTLVIVTVLIISAMIAGCFRQQAAITKTLALLGPQGEIQQADTAYQIIDYEYLDVRTIAVKAEILQKELGEKSRYPLSIQNETYFLVPNPLKPSIFIVDLPDTLSIEEIKAATLKDTGKAAVSAESRNAITIQSLVIQKSGEDACGSDIFRIGRILFTQMRSASIFVFDDQGNFIVPTYIQSSLEKDYRLGEFIQARSAAGGSVHQAFELLEQNHMAVEIHPNLVTFVNGQIHIECAIPCEGVLLKHLGKEGDLMEPDNVYQIIDNRSTAATWNVDILSSRLPEPFKSAQGWKLIMGDEDYVFTPNPLHPDMYGVEIPETHTDDIQMIRNACFVGTGGEVDTYTLTLEPHPQEGGTVTGEGNYAPEEEVEIQANPNERYRFVNWAKGEAVISESSEYTYTMPAENVTLVANFELIPPETYTLTLNSNPVAGGTVPGAGSYEAGVVVPITATPNEGYDFVNWTKGTEVISAQPNFSYTMPAENVTLTANFSESAFPSYALIYNGVSSAEECPEAVAHVAELAGLNIKYISDLSKLPQALNDTAVFIIGGTEDDLGPIIRAFTPQVDKAFKEWLHNGGRFLGICGGGFLASRGWWERNRFVTMLGIIPADSDDFLSHSRPVILPIQWLGSVRPMYFQAGPKFILKSTSEQVKIIARYMDGQIAALIATYGNGKVAVCGPHPEAPRSWSYETPNPGDWVSSIDLAVALLQELLSRGSFR